MQQQNKHNLIFLAKTFLQIHSQVLTQQTSSFRCRHPAMLFSNEMFSPIVDTDMYANNTRFIDVAYLRESSNDKNRDDTMLRLFVLSCTMGTSSNNTGRITSSGNFGANKKAKNSNTTTYNRYFLVADLQNPPHCAAILPRSVDEASRLLSVVNGGPFVGVPFCCAEPYPARQTLGDFLPVLQLPRSPFLPLRYVAPHLESTEANMAMPRNIGETNYFILTEKEITLHCINVCPEQTCLGIQCDRQRGKSGCSCQHSTNHTSSVYEFDLEFPIPASVHRADQSDPTDVANTTTVVGFRSLKTTKVFFQNYEIYCTRHTTRDQERNRIALRHQFETMVQHINNSGGWTIVGWFMMGSVVDAGSDVTEKIQNKEITIHISYLYPSESDTLFQTDDYKENLIKLE